MTWSEIEDADKVWELHGCCGYNFCFDLNRIGRDRRSGSHIVVGASDKQNCKTSTKTEDLSRIVAVGFYQSTQLFGKIVHES
jgi:hypothetical protein